VERDDLSPALLRDQLEAATDLMDPVPDVTFKAMFGGYGVYVDGRIFATLSNVGLALKLPPDAQAELLALPGAARLRYEPDAPESKQYVVVPETLRADPEALQPWAERSITHARTQPPPRPRKR
jgi:TfoX/Sxy family transcriptional regulator of competence genes